MDLEDSGSHSARSVSSLEEGSVSSRSKKSKTLSRLRKLKKPAANRPHSPVGFAPRPPGSEENNNANVPQLPNGLLNGHTEPNSGQDGHVPSTEAAGELFNKDDDVDLSGRKPLGSPLFPSPLAPTRPGRRGLGGLEPLAPLKPLEPLDGSSPGDAFANSRNSSNGGDAGEKEGGMTSSGDKDSNEWLPGQRDLPIDGAVVTETSDGPSDTEHSIPDDEIRKASLNSLQDHSQSSISKSDSFTALQQGRTLTDTSSDIIDKSSTGQILADDKEICNTVPEKGTHVGTSVTIVEDDDYDSDDLIIGGPMTNSSAVEAENLSNSLKLERGIFQESLATPNKNSNRNESDGSPSAASEGAIQRNNSEISQRTVIGGNDNTDKETERKDDANDDIDDEEDDSGDDDEEDDSGDDVDVDNDDKTDEMNLKRYLAVKQKQIEEEDEVNSSASSLSRAGRLSPITTASAPPPLPDNFASPALRTAYKRDDLGDSMVSAESPSESSTSMASTAMLLHTLTNKSARIRNTSYLSGGVQNRGSLIGKEELESHLPGRRLRIFVATWNMHEDKEIPENLDDLLMPHDCEYIQDIYVIGTQESCPDISEWVIRLQETLGPSHVLLHSASHGVLNCAIFIRRDLIWFCSPVEESRVSTRPGSMIKTKGAMAVSFNFFGTSFIFIVSHFTSGDENMKERLLDYEKILKGISLPEKVPPTKKFNVLTSDVTTRFDCVFWCGDFNFRLAENKARVEGWIDQLSRGNEDDYNILLKHDQLIKAMQKNEIFKGFREGKIEFLPTYKFDLGEDVYDTSTKARVPSYTDRVLFKSRKESDISVSHYSCCEEIKTSDHRPVYALFEASLRPGKDGTMTGGGMFDREVFIEGIKRRAAKAGMSKRNQSSSTVCSVM